MREPTTEVIRAGNTRFVLEIIGEYGRDTIDPVKWHQETLEMCAEYRRLFNPTWELISNHETLTFNDVLYLSQGVDPLSAKKLAIDLEILINADDKRPLYEKYSKEIDHGLISWLKVIRHNGELRGDEINANYHLFSSDNGRIDRQKYYEWMKKNNKAIPEKFALFPIQESEPKVIKGNKQSFDRWMKWRIEIKQGLNIKDLMPYGFKTILANEAKTRWNYKDDSPVIESWRRLKIVASKDRNTRIT